MMKLLTLFSLVFMSAGVGVALGDDSVQSHAYLFPSDDYAQPLQLYVLIEQPGTIRFITCQQSGGVPIPQTSADLTTLLGSSRCTPDTKPSLYAGAETHVRIFHQKDSDRYVKLDTTLIWDVSGIHVKGADVGAYTRSVTFDNNAKDTMNILYTWQDVEDGQNPSVSTFRVTKFKKQDVVFQYPAINEKPIEQ